MLVKTKLYKLPLIYDGLKFEFVSCARGRTGRSHVYEIDLRHSLSMSAALFGNTLVRSPGGGIASVIDNGAGILVDVYATHEGIFVGGEMIAIAEDLADDRGLWHFWEYGPHTLFQMALDLMA